MSTKRRFTRRQYYWFFVIADSDLDNFITKRELQIALQNHGYKGSKSDIDLMFQSTDLNADQKISLEEYMICMGQKPSKQNVVHVILKIFGRYDGNKDGRVNRNEYDKSIVDLKEELTVEEYRRVVRLAEKEDKDYFDYVEFAKNVEAKWERREQMDAFWRRADADKDGFLILEELTTVLIVEGYTRTEIEIKFREMDTSGDGKISYEEYIAAMEGAPEYVHRSAFLRKIFFQFDTDHSGTISKAELKEACKELGKEFTDTQMQQIMENADKDNSGELDYEEFVDGIEEILSAQDAYEKFFRDADTDNSGDLTVDELVIALRKGGYTGSEFQIRRMFNATDLSGDAKIQLDEYLVEMGRAPLSAHRTAFMRKIFQTFDENGDGQIDKREMQAIFKEMGHTMTNKEMEEVMAIVDTDKSGALDYEEFIVMWEKANKGKGFRIP